MFCFAALPAEATSPAQVTAWKAHLAALPPLPLVGAAKASFNKQKIAPILKGDGFPTTDKGQRSNSENTEMYPLRRIQPPFRTRSYCFVFGIASRDVHCDYCTATPADCYIQISSTQSVADQHDDIISFVDSTQVRCSSVPALRHRQDNGHHLGAAGI